MNQKVFRKETIVLFDGAVSYGLDIPKSGDSRLEKIVEKDGICKKQLLWIAVYRCISRKTEVKMLSLGPLFIQM